MRKTFCYSNALQYFVYPRLAVISLSMASFTLFLVTVVILVHLFSIPFTQMFPLTDGCAVYGFQGHQPRVFGKLALAVMHYGFVIILTAKTVYSSMVVFVKITSLTFSEEKKTSKIHPYAYVCNGCSLPFSIKQKGTILFFVFTTGPCVLK